VASEAVEVVQSDLGEDEVAVLGPPRLSAVVPLTSIYTSERERAIGGGGLAREGARTVRRGSSVASRKGQRPERGRASFSLQGSLVELPRAQI